MRYRFLTFILVLFALVGCNSGPNKKPEIDALIGTYHLAAKSKNFLETKKSYRSIPDSKIILTKDGAVTIVGLPDCYADGFGEGNGKFLDGKGQWEIDKTYGGYGVTLTIAKGESMRPGIYHGSSIQIIHKKFPFALQFIVGDPDSDEYLVYERSSS